MGGKVGLTSRLQILPEITPWHLSPPRQSDGHVIGAFLAFLSACLQGANSACLRRGVLTGTASQAMAITVPLGVPLALLAAWLSGQLFQFGELSLQGTFSWPVPAFFSTSGGATGTTVLPQPLAQ